MGSANRGILNLSGKLLLALSLGLILSDIFALFTAITGEFLPHDERFLGMNAAELCGYQGCRIVHFMIHDRVSFGGALIAIGLLYFWLTACPLQCGQAWAWWALLVSGAAGFPSFFAYLGYGYFDVWHGLATLGLLPCYVAGLIWSWKELPHKEGIRSLLRPSVPTAWATPGIFGRVCLLASSFGLIAGGLTIMTVGMTCIFVSQDLEFMGLSVDQLAALNPRLLPLIAHDRAGFGGAVCCCGLTLFMCVWAGTPSRSLWYVLTAVGVIGFGTAIGVHPAIGYNDAEHVGPAVLGAIVYAVGLAWSFRHMTNIRQATMEPTVTKLAGAAAIMKPLELPSLHKLGPDLISLSPWRRLFSLSLPFFWCGAYFVFASLDWWPLAIFALVALSFVTYGSTSHDLVHRCIGLPKRVNDLLLCVIELLALRSGHAYQAAHLHHHARYPHSDDVEAAAARCKLAGAIAEGFVFQFRIWLWAFTHARQARAWVIGEGLACVTLATLAVLLTPPTPMFPIYAVVMIMGSWIIPLTTSYIPHDPNGENPLLQTRVFRGVMASVLALEHLYHLEHHLYPAVPHQHWPKLAKRLDPYLLRAGVRPVYFWF